MKVVIIMGGKSSRMGQDKGFVSYQGKSLFERVISLVSQIDEEYYLSVSLEQFEFLGHKYRCIIDSIPDKGPLAGFFSAMAYLKEDILVVPIDMPNLTIEVLKPIIETGRTAAYQVNQWIQTLPSYWSFKDHDIIQKALYTDQLQLKSFFEKNGNLIPFYGNEKVFLNVNRPEDIG